MLNPKTIYCMLCYQEVSIADSGCKYIAKQTLAKESDFSLGLFSNPWGSLLAGFTAGWVHAPSLVCVCGVRRSKI